MTGGAELSGGRNGARLERADETDAVAHVLSARRNELQYYFAGFGLAGIAVRPHSSAGLKELPQRPTISDGVFLLPVTSLPAREMDAETSIGRRLRTHWRTCSFRRAIGRPVIAPRC